MSIHAFDFARIEREFVGICDDAERQTIAAYATRVAPILSGNMRPKNQQQAEFLRVMNRQAPPRTEFQRVWLKVYCAHLLLTALDDSKLKAQHAESRLVREKQRALDDVRSKETVVREMLLRTLDALRTFGALGSVDDPMGDWGNFCGQQLVHRVETLTAGEIEFLAKRDFPGFSPTDFYKLNNRLIDLDIAGPLLGQVKSRFPSRGFNPENAFGVYANTDGQ
ncbi:hypothetical protein [Variovorax saccharolyticus]|uniref:hypothetical protein n=1 Tax=Variovorax saccharolyticus TaxID=3053516 RepID=UPI002577560D|nr:hypothetical protein [Variovorax sp. J31P216]MDM0030467.1 hypothetical protein [Variovorax sp. J31P216]